MTDARLVWDASVYGGDLVLAGDDLAADGGLRTAVLLSLLTDRRVAAGELPAGETDRRGWWGDSLAADGDVIGSRLWLLAREAARPDVERRAEEYAREALAWLVEDGAARRVDVAVSGDGAVLCITVDVLLPSGGAERFSVTVEGG